MHFTYRAKRDQRTEASGVIDAINLSSAVMQLKRMGLFPLEVVPLESAKESSGMTAPQRTLSRPELALWSRTIGQGLTAGLSLTQSLHLVAEQEGGRPIGQVAKLLQEKVTAGMSLAGAMEQMTGIFSPVAVNLVRAGEAGGALEEVLRALADQMEVEADLIAKVQGALWYPLFVLGVGFTTVAVLLWVVVPKLALLFSETGQPLPLLTRFMITSGRSFVWVILSAMAVASSFFWAVRSKAVGFQWRERLTRILSRLPVLGPLLQQAEVSRLAATLGLLIGHGLALPSALRLAAGTVNEPELRRQVQQSERQVIEGVALSAGFRQAGMREPFLLTMVAMGEAQGDLAQAFRQAADRYHQEVDRRVKVLSSLIEPVLILFVGLVVGGIVISMLLPIFQINFAVE